jgi:hypothetical protein
MTSGDGCPKSFFAPTETAATRGRVVATSSSVVDVRLP